MSWCDKLAAVPSVGLKFDWHFAPSEDLVRSLAPLLDTLVDGDRKKFQVTSQDSFAFQFQSEDGYTYGVDPQRLFVEFQHRLRARPVSGSLPVMELLSQAQPYTALLKSVSQKTVDCAVHIPNASSRKLIRAGVVTSAQVALEDAPPGIQKFLDYLARPWGSITGGLQVHVTSKLADTDTWEDRCVHTVQQSETDPDNLLQIKFDFQRTLAKGRPMQQKNLTEFVEITCAAALEYFETLAEGTIFDVNLTEA